MPTEQAYRGDRHKETKQDLRVLSQSGLEMPTEQAQGGQTQRNKTRSQKLAQFGDNKYFAICQNLMLLKYLHKNCPTLRNKKGLGSKHAGCTFIHSYIVQSPFVALYIQRMYVYTKRAKMHWRTSKYMCKDMGDHMYILSGVRDSKQRQKWQGKFCRNRMKNMETDQSKVEITGIKLWSVRKMIIYVFVCCRWKESGPGRCYSLLPGMNTMHAALQYVCIFKRKLRDWVTSYISKIQQNWTDIDIKKRRGRFLKNFRGTSDVK